MMHRSIKWLMYSVVAVVCFVLFLYWTFPYNILKERIISQAEKELGGGYELKVADLSPSFFTGAVLKNVRIYKRGEKKVLLWRADKVKLRASLGSIIFGKTNLSFHVRSKGSRLSGRFKAAGGGFQLTADIGRFDLGDIKYLKQALGLDIKSNISGDIKITYSHRVLSGGEIILKLNEIGLKKSELDLGEGNKMPLPDLVLARGKESKIECRISRGIVDVAGIKLAGGDLNLNLKGQIRVRSRLENSTFDLKGDFKPSEKLEQAIPLLFMVEKQKDSEGRYPVSITGRIGRKKISIGEVTLPI